MKKLLIAMFVGAPLLGCTEEVIVKRVAPPADPGPEDTGEETDNTEPTPGPAKSSSTAPEDRCLDGQDLDADDVDISACPEIPTIPAGVKLGKETIGLGAWELGQTSEGDTYVYGQLSAPGTNPRILSFEGGSVAVNAENLECWAKGYYRLRRILQDPPAEWLALKNAGFQYRFFQFQTDLRNGPTGYREISSFQDHLVKWVTVISAQGVCQQPTLEKFRTYAKKELERRGLPLPTTPE